jgi:hypothetical protein
LLAPREPRKGVAKAVEAPNAAMTRVERSMLTGDEAPFVGRVLTERRKTVESSKTGTEARREMKKSEE